LRRILLGCGIGSWGDQRPSLAGYVAGGGIQARGNPPLDSARVGYPHTAPPGRAL